MRDSPYAALLPTRDPDAFPAWDVMHANAVEVLTGARAAASPRFKAGQVLISLRELNALAVLDLAGRSVVWATRGPWRAQHDPHFLDNGRLLVYDNRGAGRDSRILEYDPQTQACPWTYPGNGSPHFSSPVEGRNQRLPNGNTFIVSSRDGVLLEVNEDQEVVWSCYCNANVPFARRYAAEQLTFLKGAAYARP
jgi:hypothetical protein